MLTSTVLNYYMVVQTFSFGRVGVQSRWENSHNYRSRPGNRCKAIAPGRVHTPFVDDYLATHYPGRESEMYERLSKTQPIGRMGTPDEIAGLALYLCSDEAAFITGAIFPIDGGFVTVKP